MKERPILFSGPMVQAIPREINPKTQTRRTKGLEFINQTPAAWHAVRRLRKEEPIIDGGTMAFPGADSRSWIALANPEGLTDGGWVVFSCPYGQPGDRLIVLEKWAPFIRGDGGDGFVRLVRFAADGAEVEAPPELWDWWDQKEHRGYEWRSPYHLPRLFSRITLEIVSVRVQRVQEISEEDAMAEGAWPVPIRKVYPSRHAADVMAHQGGFRILWNSINARWRGIYKRIDGKRQLVGFECYPWAEEDAPPIPAKARKFGLPCRIIANPWVWAIEFKRIAGAG